MPPTINTQSFSFFVSLEATRDIRTTLGQQFEEERSRLIQENQKLVEQLKGKTEEKSEGLMSMVSQAIKRSTSSSQITSVKETKQDGESLESSMQKVNVSNFNSDGDEY